MEQLLQRLRKGARFAWHLIWEDDSVLSWVINIVLAFVLMKFVIYPGLGFVLTTSHPVVAVVSGSMEHDASFEKWFSAQEDFYSSYGISQEAFREFPLAGGINTGDIIVLRGVSPESLAIGDIIVFGGAGPEPIIHRVVRKWEQNQHYYVETKGDHNQGVASIDRNIVDQRIIGKAMMKIPYLGYVKIWFSRLVVCSLSPQAAGCR
ncbi:signal peptidase I [Candidatus Woesearchaeota archaeon]|nr:signal peptidase I [Candidatus Woesearchaeota archaeon]